MKKNYISENRSANIFIKIVLTAIALLLLWIVGKSVIIFIQSLSLWP
jgi:hypothetical protein